MSRRLDDNSFMMKLRACRLITRYYSWKNVDARKEFLVVSKFDTECWRQWRIPCGIRIWPRKLMSANVCQWRVLCGIKNWYRIGITARPHLTTTRACSMNAAEWPDLNETIISSYHFSGLLAQMSSWLVDNSLQKKNARNRFFFTQQILASAGWRMPCSSRQSGQTWTRTPSLSSTRPRALRR